MNMLFKNTTKYSKECYENFLIFHNKKFGVSSNFYTLLIVILMAFCIVLQLKAGNTQLVFIFILTLICFLLWRIFHPIKEVKDEFESKKFKKNLHLFFVFMRNILLFLMELKLINIIIGNYIKFLTQKITIIFIWTENMLF